MLRSIEAGETFIVWDDDGTPAATITINRFAKPELWTEQERAEGLRDAGLAVGRPAPACPSVEVAVRSFSTPSRPALRGASGRPPARQRHDGHRGEPASPSRQRKPQQLRSGRLGHTFSGRPVRAGSASAHHQKGEGA
jgi:hypothetical protein